METEAVLRWPAGLFHPSWERACGVGIMFELSRSCRAEPSGLYLEQSPVPLPNLPTTQAMLLWLHRGLRQAGYHQTAQSGQLLFHKADAHQHL